MILKLQTIVYRPIQPFESSVKSYDTKTTGRRKTGCGMFESSVKSYDTKTKKSEQNAQNKFESSVKSYDTKTSKVRDARNYRLRVV